MTTKHYITSAIRHLGAFIRNASAWVRTLIVLAALAIVGAAGYYITHRPERNKKIDPVVSQTVTEIKKIKEFCTAKYFEETVVSASRPRTIGSDNIAIIVKGTVRAGFDLSKMEVDECSDTSIAIVLPKPQVLDVVTNPTDCETFVECGAWSHRQVTRYKNIARGRILRHALDDGIMDDATQSGIDRIRFIFLALGYNNVSVTIAEK